MKIFVDWHGNQVMNERQYQEWLSNEVEIRLQNVFELGEYLSENFTNEEIFFFDDKQKEKVMASFREYLEDMILEDEYIYEYSVKAGEIVCIS